MILNLPDDVCDTVMRKANEKKSYKEVLTKTGVTTSQESVGDKHKSVMEKKIVKRSTNDNTKLNDKIHTKHTYIHKACMKK